MKIKNKGCAVVSAIMFSMLCAFTNANAAPIPEQLASQVQKLTALVSDGYAVGYPEGSITQTIKKKNGAEITLVVFTVEGFGGGNNHTQYLAAFEKNADAKDKPYYTFLDVISIGGKGWRGVFELNAKAVENTKTGAMNIFINGLQVSDNDAPNFPSKKIVINVLYNKARLSEVTN